MNMRNILRPKRVSCKIIEGRSAQIVRDIIMGGLIASLIQRIAHINTIVSAASVVVAFGVSVAVGLVFGIMPARKAAMQDPIVCLRYE